MHVCKKMKHWKSGEGRKIEGWEKNPEVRAVAHEGVKERREHAQSTIEDQLKTKPPNKTHMQNQPTEVAGIVERFTSGEGPSKRGFCGCGQKVDLLS